MEQRRHTVTDTRCTMPAAEHARTMQRATSGMTRAWNPLPNTMFSKLLTAVNMKMKSQDATYPAMRVISLVEANGFLYICSVENTNKQHRMDRPKEAGVLTPIAAVCRRGAGASNEGRDKK